MNTHYIPQATMSDVLSVIVIATGVLVQAAGHRDGSEEPGKVDRQAACGDAGLVPELRKLLETVEPLATASRPRRWRM